MVIPRHLPTIMPALGSVLEISQMSRGSRATHLAAVLRGRAVTNSSCRRSVFCPPRSFTPPWTDRVPDSLAHFIHRSGSSMQPNSPLVTFNPAHSPPRNSHFVISSTPGFPTQKPRQDSLELQVSSNHH
jgi:hypothetical protein